MRNLRVKVYVSPCDLKKKSTTGTISPSVSLFIYFLPQRLLSVELGSPV